MKSLLLNLNLNFSPLLLEDYKEAHLNEIGADSSRSGDEMTWEQFKKLFILILRNQTTLFREIYNNKKYKELDLQKHLNSNEESLRVCFKAYDVDDSGYLDFTEMTSLLTELSLHKQF